MCGKHSARDLRYGKQRVSPSYHFEQLSKEKNVSGNGTILLHLARD